MSVISDHSNKSKGGKQLWADIDEAERLSVKTTNDKKEKIDKLLIMILEEEDKLFAKACLERLNRLIINEIGLEKKTDILQSPINQLANKHKFDMTQYKLNFHCTTYHWISECRPKSRIMIKSNVEHDFLFKVYLDEPYLGIGVDYTSWYKLSLNDVVIEFLDENGLDTKLKVKLVKILKPCVIP